MDFDLEIICSYDPFFETFQDSNIENLKSDITMELSKNDTLNFVESEFTHAIFQLQRNKEYILSFCKYKVKD